MKKMNYATLLALAFLSGFLPTHAQNISDTVDATHYAIHLTEVDTDNETIKGHTEIDVTPNFGTLEGANFQLKDLTVDSVFVSQQSTDYTYIEDLITVPFEEPLTGGDTITVDIYYHGTPFSEEWGGFHFSGDYAFNLGVGFESVPHNLGKSWFPCVDDFVDRAYYDYFISVETPKTAVCGGILQNKTQRDGKTVYHWKMNYTIPPYLASVAIGEYVLYEDIYEGIAEDVVIQIWVRPFEEDNVEGSFAHLKDILAVYEEHWGAYPFSRVGFVSTAQGAMEHATNIAYPYGTIDGNTTYEWLYAHELSHMWFGDKVTCADAGDMWLNEGWAVFNEFLFREGIYDTSDYMQDYNSLHKEVLHYAHTPSGDGDYYALYDIPQDITYGTTVYDKGGLVVHTLRHYLGDEVFFPAMQQYLEAYAYQPASSYDLMEFLTQETGTDMSSFFDNWVFTPGFPHFEIDSVTDNQEGHKVFVQQKRKGREIFSEENILEITFMSEQWDTWTDTMMVSGSHSSKTFDVPFVPETAMADYYNKVADATTDRVVTIEEPGEIDMGDVFLDLEVSAVEDSALVRATHNWVAPDTMQQPVPGLRLSDYRYWKIDGIMPEDFSASCQFHYNKNNYLDHTLIIDESDEITLLYREDQSHEWQETEYTQVGPWLIGHLEVEELQRGEYTLAVWEEGFTEANRKKVEPAFYAFPNPSDDHVIFRFNTQEKGRINIYDTSGHLIEKLSKSVGSSEISWETGDKKGVFLAKWLLDNRQVASKKIVIH
ncbi:MAG: T9SS type A sorting domain-containing protein [Bacteroidales bacterium]|nr:T9SS type A sorting domain-containing protein [Bacteroidales bacterium]MCF8334356.1 T9SS type A sorting domain-containing protein [Bacteroidales bacterium]